jgi:hypothetical protein
MEELKIGIVSEGISDYWVIKHIVARFLKDKEINFVQLHPKITPKGKQDGYGGWQKVFEYISQKEYIVEYAQKEDCDYVIIQLDTDVCEQYKVKKSTNPETLFCDVSTKIQETTHSDFDRNKIIPAICIHSLECWLIPFISDDTRKCSRVDNCINVINNEIRSEGTIDKDNKGAAMPLYCYILSKKKKVKEIQEIAHYNVGFYKFIETLSELV